MGWHLSLQYMVMWYSAGLNGYPVFEALNHNVDVKKYNIYEVAGSYTS